MKKIRQLSTMKQVTIFSLCATIIVFILSSPCFFFNLMEVPLGLLLGGLGSCLSLSLFTIKENSLPDKILMKLSVVFVIIMSLIHICIIILAGCLYYLAELHIFNLFATVAGTFIGLIVFVVFTLINKK